MLSKVIRLSVVAHDPFSAGRWPAYPCRMLSEGGEAAFFNDRNATVMRTRVILNGVTYPTRAISSIRKHVQPKSGFFAVVCCVFGVPLLIVALSLFVRLQGSGLVFLALGLCLTALPIMAYRKARDRVTLVLTTQGTEVHALTSDEPGYIDRVISAIHAAIDAQ